MTSKTLFSKPMPFFWQNIKRNQWLWIFHTIVLCLIFPVNIFFSKVNWEAQLTQKITRLLNLNMPIDFNILPFIVFPLLYAILSFKYLTQHHESVLIHSLPVSRKKLFFEHFFSGLFMTLMPLLVNSLLLGLLMLVMPRGTITPDLIINWTVYTTLFSSVFYTVGLLSVMIIGTPILQMLFAFIAMLLPLGLEMMIQQTLRLVLKGYTESISSYLLTNLSPLTGFLSFFRRSDYTLFPMAFLILYSVYSIVFTVVAYGLYQRRRIENVGQTIQVSVLGPVLKYLATFCSMLLFGLILEGVTNYPAALVVGYLLGGIIGYVFSEMAIQKTLQCQLRLKPLLLFMVLFFAGFSLLAADLTGYGNKQFALEEIEGVYFNTDRVYVQPLGDDKFMRSPEAIAAVQDLYLETIETVSPLFWLRKNLNHQREESNYYFTFVNKQGQQFKRFYRVEKNRLQKSFEKVYSTPEFIQARNPILNMPFESVESLRLSSAIQGNTLVDSKAITALLEAYKQDVYEHHAKTIDMDLQSYYSMEMIVPIRNSSQNKNLKPDQDTESLYCEVFPNYTRTLKVIKDRPENAKMLMNDKNIDTILLKSVRDDESLNPTTYIDKNRHENVITVTDRVTINKILQLPCYTRSTKGSDYIINCFANGNPQPLMTGYITEFKQ